MDTETADRREVRRVLSAALDDAEATPDRDLERAAELLGSDAKRVRVGAAWALGLVADAAPSRTLPHVSRIAAHLEDPETRTEAARALAYVARANPEGVEGELRTLEGALARRCRKALWGRLASRTVIEVPGAGDEEADGESGGRSMGRGDGDVWGWAGGGSARVYDTESGTDRHRPPTDRPVDPPRVEYEHDRYTPVEVIHRGERAASFKVVYRTPDGRTAPGLFKRFAPPEVREFRSTFDRRVRMWQSIDDHEAVLPVVDWGTDPVPWIVTAYEDGSGVADLGRSGRLPAAVWTLRTVADALRFAHARGVIHGGLTPGSVVRSSIITEPDAWRFPRVTDWGYVSLLREGTAPDSIPGRYLAPEHADPDPSGVDGLTDVYGFGVLAHEALFGRVPAEADEGPLVDAFSIPPTTDRRLPDLESFLRRCLAVRKTERFETVEAMTAAFRAVTEGVDG